MVTRPARRGPGIRLQLPVYVLYVRIRLSLLVGHAMAYHDMKLGGSVIIALARANLLGWGQTTTMP